MRRIELRHRYGSGFDIGFVKDKVDLSATWHDSRTVDVILITRVPPSTGYQFEATIAGAQFLQTDNNTGTPPFAQVGYPLGVNRGTADGSANTDANRKAQLIQAAHTLKARFYMHTAERVGAAAYTAARTAALQGISSDANTFRTTHTSATSERNMWRRSRRHPASGSISSPGSVSSI